MPGQKISGPALAAVGAGTVFLYAGIKGTSVLASFQSIVSGKSPGGLKQANPISAPGGGYSLSAPANISGVGAAAGGVYTSAQIRSLWILAGGDPARADTAVCIAEHESGGNITVTSPNPDGGTNVGLWQLDTPGGKGAGYSVSQLQSALTNARVAIAGSRNGADWSAWATAPMCGV